MATVYITDEQVERTLRLRSLLGAEKDEWLHDNEQKGFAVRLAKSGKAYAHFNYWQGGRGGRVKRISIGEISKKTLTVDQARQKIYRFKDQLENGEDPKATHERMKAETFGVAWEQFTKGWSTEDRYRRGCKALVERDALPGLGSRPLTLITRRDIAPLVEKIGERSRSRAWELFKNLRLCFNWCVDSGLLEHSPMERMKPPKAVPARERLLSAKEVAAFWRASGQLEFPWKQIFCLMMLTACRREEIGAMRWTEIDGEVWTIPGGRTKNGKKHIIDLPPLGTEIINSVPKVHDMLFTTTGITSPSGYSKPKKRLDTLMRADIGEFEPFRLHDLRRTIVTTLNEEHDVSEEVGERLLNHVKIGITKVYNKATLREKRKEALLIWSKYVIEIAESV